MRRTALVLVVLLLVMAVPSFAKTAFSGSYNITGRNPSAATYKGTLTISARGEVYDVVWSVGGMTYTGIGIAQGDALSVAYTGGDRTWFGVVIYRARTDGTLDGRWAVAGAAPKLGTETATRR